MARRWFIPKAESLFRVSLGIFPAKNSALNSDALGSL